MKHIEWPRAAAVSCLWLGAGLATGARAATDAGASAGPDSLQEIIVTGSRIKGRTVLDSPVPVDVLSAEDLSLTGALSAELGQALQALSPSFNFPRQSNSGGADHVRAAQLRGMSPDQVLVLVNGKRRHTSALVNLESKTGKGTTPVDFNSIPLNAIKRIEVLRDGAGAQYGSDAIAGVINIILDDSEGGEAALSYGQNRTKFEPTDQNLHDGGTTVAQLKEGFRFGEDGHFNVGAEYRHHSPTNRSGFDTIIFQADPTPANLATQGHVNYAAGDGGALDVDAWFNGRLPLSSGAELYAFGTYDHRDSTGATFFRYPDSSSNVVSVYPNGFRPVSVGTNKDLSLTAGVSGNAAAWSWDTSLTFGQNKFVYDLRNSINASLGAASPTSFHLGDFRFDQLSLNLDASRPLSLSAFAQAVNLAVGAEYRHEKFQTQPGDPASYAAGPFTAFDAGAQAGPGLQPADAADATRSVGSAYVDLSTNLTKALLVELAGRFEHYSDFGNTGAGKLSALFQVTPTFALRGAVSNSFRAPSLSQISYKATSTSFGEGGVLASLLTLPVASPIAKALGAQDLKAEKSVNLSVGFTFAPVDSFNMTVDFFHIKVKDRITISERISGTDLTSFIQSQFGLTGIEGVNFFTNAIDTRTKGVDVVATYRQGFAPGALKLTAAYSYAKTEVDGVRATPAQLQALGFNDVLFGVEERNTIEDAAPRSKAILSADWSAQTYSLVARLTRYGSAVRVFDFGGGFEPRQVYSARTQLDLEAEVRPLKNLSFAIGGTNVLDKYPDRSSDDINYAGNFPYDVLSPIGFNGAYFYARAQVKF
ncbi:MAG: TonB-dependent receptor [Steroidobacteraceae bacterium]